ncbi:phenazine biosynthesis protein PhzF family protein [Sporocytophaga myxococcoides]|uniref:Phenazine biosynthesis protein PhzF family protein n=1 Tax=Sporocytophaga myxococcoides TaxID=153721 RepID=A0A098LAV6_9BACT|nr:PhzF family phenazine biosynthesis protein [Sporocytophaga myxococcoides]GAL83584.1 phenazine biosynthesis protein PhzF family protein [Sporocytophaga myxococcoides]
MSKRNIYQVDAFTDVAFKGNPAGVMILDNPMEEQLMQKIANEMNLAETAFAYPVNDGYNLRWFTPEKEVKLCGHATLATAHIMWQEGFIKTDKINFHTLSGILSAERVGDYIQLNFPAIIGRDTNTKELVKAQLGVDPIGFEESDKGYMVVELTNSDEVKNFLPDSEKLLKLGEFVVIITARDKEYDFVSRVFAPAFGIDEDPVTGSAHCLLATYWNNVLGKKSFKAYQASKRGGQIDASLEKDRVYLTGKAVTVIKGEILF